MASNYFYKHSDIASTTGLTSQRVGKLAVKLSSVLDAYRIRGKSNQCIYDSSGLKVWEQIARMEKEGIGPQMMEEKLRKLIGIDQKSGKAEDFTETYALEKFYNGLEKGERIEREHHDDEKSLYQTIFQTQNKHLDELKKAHDEALKAKDKTIEILNDRLKSQDVLLLETTKRKGFWKRLRS